MAKAVCVGMGNGAICVEGSGFVVMGGAVCAVIGYG